SASMPKLAAPANASPLSFSRMRLWAGILLRRCFAGLGCRRVADLEAAKAGDRDVLAELGDLGLHKLPHAERGFLHVRLLEKADLLVELVHAAFDDLIDHLFGLAFQERTRALDVLLLIEGFLRHVFLADELGIASRDVH